MPNGFALPTRRCGRSESTPIAQLFLPNGHLTDEFPKDFIGNVGKRLVADVGQKPCV